MINCTCSKVYKNPYELTFDCPAAWDIIQQGNTKGIFQLEGNLGQNWAQKMKPKTIDDLAMLIAIIRPGVLNSGMAQRLIDVRNGTEEPSYLHPSLEPILKSTYSCLVYQEQAIRIVTDLAGFTLAEADYYVRKGIGKKLPEIISQLKQLFIDKCAEKGLVSEDHAREIFDWIKEGQRYSFNACISPNTMVEKENGEFVAIDEVVIGDKIKTTDGYTTILNKFENGIQETYEITMESGKTIECTLDHEFMCENGIKHKLSCIIDNNLKIICEDD